MEPDDLKPKEENLFSLAAEMGLAVLADQTESTEESKRKQQEAQKSKPFSQLT